MTSVPHADRPNNGRSAPPWPAILVTLITSLAAGAAGHLLAGPAAWAAICVLALVGGALALVMAQGPGEARESALRHETDEIDVERMTHGAALVELEKLRRQVDTATSTIRGGKDPLTEVAELRIGPLHDLLEAARDASTSRPMVSRIAIDEEELVGSGGDRLPEPWPPGADDPTTFDPRARAEVLRGMDLLIAGLERLARGLGRPSDSPSDLGHAAGAARSAAQLVDAVVHTAADGIEDLAAGLMRANELASVAERVTNRATLLALNAALEATRSGSEAFAAIAEETRRLAEFAREATDTISRLASEIEYKVGETITAIHATSEDAKSAVAALSGAPIDLGSGPAVSRDSIAALLAQARDVRRNLTGASTGDGGAGPQGPGSGDRGTDQAAPVARLAPPGEDPSHVADLETPDEASAAVELPPPILLATDLAPEAATEPGREETPSEHRALLERLKPSPGTPG